MAYVGADVSSISVSGAGVSGNETIAGYNSICNI